MRPCEEARARAGNELEPDLGLVPICPGVVDVDVEVDTSWFVELELGALLVRRWKMFTIFGVNGWKSSNIE